ncbi:hypothetical protein AMJ52_04615 [candidate division TA06 bacterium DG_78]|uniref:GIY-YIG domain-containing protein n=1 Tax=candidate division TA06 bacterium DG_78 TaxID=1703772 RepID=A0A0S7YFT2_UNCT6|nr:MAG: hypothetical protein AMJ52_04615 [candidate division TA06 bacterium DG_78]
MIYPAPPKWFYVYLVRNKKGRVYSTRRKLPMELIYFEAYKYRQNAFEREKKLKHYGSALRNLKLRLKDIFSKGGAR